MCGKRGGLEQGSLLEPPPATRRPVIGPLITHKCMSLAAVLAAFSGGTRGEGRSANMTCAPQGKCLLWREVCVCSALPASAGALNAVTSL